MRASRLLIIALFTLPLAACAASPTDMAAVSSGQIGCSAADIAVSDAHSGISTSTWTASCKGKSYFCSASDTLKGASCKAAS